MALSPAAYLEKNTLNNTGVWLVLLEIIIPDTDTLYLCSNTENITWPTTGGDEYIAFPFELDDISDSSKGEVPQLVIRVSNVTRAIEAYLEISDGGVGAEVRIKVVHSEHLDQTEPEVELVFEVLKTSTDENWVQFTIGASNPYNKIFPRNRVLRFTCRYREFKGPHCGYTGVETICDRSYERCKELDNVTRFGNAIGVGARGVYL